MRKERVIYSAILVGILIGVVFFSGTTSTVTINDTTVTTDNIAPTGSQLFIQGNMNMSNNNLTNMSHLELGPHYDIYGFIPFLSMYKNESVPYIAGPGHRDYGIYYRREFPDDMAASTATAVWGSSIFISVPESNHENLNILRLYGQQINLNNNGLNKAQIMEGFSSSINDNGKPTYNIRGYNSYIYTGAVEAKAFRNVFTPCGNSNTMYGFDNEFGLDNYDFIARVNKAYGANIYFEDPYWTNYTHYNETYGYYFDGNFYEAPDPDNQYGVYLTNISANNDSYAIYADSGDTFLNGTHTNVTGKVAIGEYEEEGIPSNINEPKVCIFENSTEGDNNALHVYKSVTDDYIRDGFFSYQKGIYVKNELPINSNATKPMLMTIDSTAYNRAPNDVYALYCLNLNTRNFNSNSDINKLFAIGSQRQAKSHVNDTYGFYDALMANTDTCDIDNNFFNYFKLHLTGTGFIENSYGTWLGFSEDISTGGIVNNSYGLYVDNTNDGTQINNTYGVYIKNVSSEVNSYAIYVEDGDTLLQNTTIDNVLHLTPVATAPTSPTEGDIYYNSTTHKPYCYNGSAWNPFW